MINHKILACGLLVFAAAGYGVYDFLSNWDYHPTIVFVDNPKQYETERESNAQTYGELFGARNIWAVDDNVSNEQMSHILLGRMFPNYRSKHTFAKNQLFAGSPALVLNGHLSRNGVDKGGIFILDQNENDDLDLLRESCIAALKKPLPKTKTDAQFYRLKEWCAVSTVGDVLKRHKFRIPQKDEEWKKILASQWITDSQYHDKQSFFSAADLKKMTTGANDTEKISVLKNRCGVALGQTFTRTYFPATTSFLKPLGHKADEFQEAALFCTVPTTVEQYVKKAMKGKLRDQIPKELKNDFCYEDGMSVEQLKNIKTTDPMGGKSFWCGVRMMYEKSDPKLSRS